MVYNGNERPIYVVSGGAGASGELLLQTLLAQFPQERVQVSVFPFVHNSAQVADVVTRAAAENAMVVHTMVDGTLREQLHAEAAKRGVADVDLVGDLLGTLSQRLGSHPLGQPGRYRQFRNDYFRRIAAIEYAVTHDDGQRIEEFVDADIVLLGVSRVGKTPLSIYLSLEGWKTANYPLVPNMPLPSAIQSVPASRVVGLTIIPQQLIRFRIARQGQLGISTGTYFDLQHAIEEVRAANHLYSRNNYHVVDVTDKPIESVSEEIVAAVIGQSG